MEKKSPVLNKTEEMFIGKNRYIVTTTFNETARETIEQKYLRYVTDRVSTVMNAEQQPVGALSL